MTTYVYLDTNIYNRPFDDQTQPRIWLETLAFSVILQLIEKGDLLLVASTVLQFANSRNPHKERREWVRRVLSLAAAVGQVNPSIRKRADTLVAEGIQALDALHLAAAEALESDYFVTSDDRLARRYQALPEDQRPIAIYSPTEFVRHITGGVR